MSCRHEGHQRNNTDDCEKYHQSRLRDEFMPSEINSLALTLPPSALARQNVLQTSWWIIHEREHHGCFCRNRPVVGRAEYVKSRLRWVLIRDYAIAKPKQLCLPAERRNKRMSLTSTRASKPALAHPNENRQDHRSILRVVNKSSSVFGTGCGLDRARQ